MKELLLLVAYLCLSLLFLFNGSLGLVLIGVFFIAHMGVIYTSQRFVINSSVWLPIKLSMSILGLAVFSDFLNGNWPSISNIISYSTLPFVLICLSSSSDHEITSLANLFSIVALLFIFTVFLFILLGIGIQIESVSNISRVSSEVGFNSMAFHIGCAAIFATYKLKPRSLLFSLIFSFLSLYLLTFTSSRTIIIAYLISIIWLYSDSFLFKTSRAILGFALVFLPIILFLSKNWLYEIIFLRSGNEQEMLLSGREDIWFNIINSFDFYTFIFGVGSKNMNNVIGLEGITSAHNSYLQLICETGLIGLTLFLILIINISRVIIRNNINRTIIASLLFILLTSFTESRYFSSGGIGSILATFSCILVFKNRRDISGKVNS